MRTSSKSLLTLAFLSLALGACGKKNKGSETPGGPAGAAIDPAKASAEAKKDFRAAAAKYESAKSDGNLSTGECESVANAFQKVYKEHGKQMAIAKFNAGAVWEECGNIEKAKSIYTALTKEVPKYDLSYNNLGVLAWNSGNEVRALEYFKKAVKVNPKTRAPRNNLAAALRNKYSNDPESSTFTNAEKEIQRVLAVDSDNQVAYENLARLYYDRGRLKDRSYLILSNLVVTQALRVLEENGEQSAEIWNLKGLLFMEEDNQVEALRAFKKAVEIKSDYADAHMNIAMISIRFRDYAGAEESLKVALKDKRQRKNVETRIAMGVAKRGLKKFKEAEEEFQAAKKMDSSDPRADYNLGILYQEHLATSEDLDVEGIKKHYKTAKDYYSKFLQKAGSKKELSAYVDDAKSRVDNIDESFRVFAEMAELQRKAKELERIAKEQEAEELKRLQNLEQKAIEAAQKAEEDAKKAEEAAKKDDAKKDDAKKDDAKKADPKKADPKKK